MHAIEVRGLHKRYGDHVALAGIDFQVDRGEVVGLLGPNGAGKSTAMRILTGFLAQSAGEVRVAGIDALREPVEARRHVGYLPESAPVYRDMRVEDYLDFVGRVRGMGSGERAAAAARAMEATGLVERRRQPIATLSKGYRQRVGLAQAMIHDPDILILDEPTSGLDPNQVRGIRSLIRELGDRRTVLVSTHVLSEVQATCDRVIILDRGRIVADGPTAEVTARRRGRLLQACFAPGKVRLGAADLVGRLREELPGVIGVRRLPGVDQREGEVLVEIHAQHDLRAEVFAFAVRQGLTLIELRQERSSLEDVFRDLTMGEPAGEGERVLSAPGGGAG